MVEFIVMAVILAISIGLFVGLVVTADFKSKWKRGIVTFIIATSLGCLISGMFAAEKASDESQWNNGYCECGGEWLFSNAQHIRNSGTVYYYHCNNCNDTIELHSIFRKIPKE